MTTSVDLFQFDEASGLQRVDVKVKDLPKNFLGMGFDLRALTEGQKALHVSLDHYEMGQDLKNLPDGEKAMSVVGNLLQREGKLVFGLTFKADHLPQLPAEIVLVSFFLKIPQGQEVQWKFENKVFSLFQGKRIDMSGVKWENQILQNDLLPLDVIETNLTSQQVEQLQGDPLNQQKASDFKDVSLPVFILVGVVVLMLVTVGLRLFTGKSEASRNSRFQQF